MTAPIGFLFLACSSVACWFAGSETRAGDRVRLADWLRQYGRALALVLALFQLGMSVPLIGPAQGPLLVCIAWMVIGSVFVACVNAWPQRTMQCALWAVVPGILLLLIELNALM